MGFEFNVVRRGRVNGAVRWFGNSCFTGPQETDAAMSKPDYDDPDVEELWCAEQQKIVANYVRSQKVKHGRIGEWPAWHVAPYASIWAIESVAHPEWIGWWVICGDLPTDYISAADVEPPQHPRKAMRVFARNWLEVVKAWKDGREIENTRIGDPSDVGQAVPDRSGTTLLPRCPKHEPHRPGGCVIPVAQVLANVATGQLEHSKIAFAPRSRTDPQVRSART